MEKYEREYDYNKVAEIKYSIIPTLEQQIKDLEEKMQSGYDNALLKEEVTENENLDTEILEVGDGLAVSKLCK